MGKRCMLYADIQSLQTEVTGSGTLVTANFPDGTKEHVLVDFGLFQGSDENVKLNSKIGFLPKDLSAILVTHAHIDHIGRIPMLYKNGANCKTFMTNDTLIVAEKLLNNTACILANNEKKDEQLYSIADYEKAMIEFRSCECDDVINITEHISVKFIQNQHIAGAAMIFICISYENERCIKLLFSGDVNNTHAFSTKHTTLPSWLKETELSMLMCESTYGARKKVPDEHGKFKREIEEFSKEDKTILIPAFSFGRFQNILLCLKELQDEGKLSLNIPIYIDGKLGIDITAIWAKLETVELKDFIPTDVQIVQDKKILMADKNPKIIVTTSGMGNFGPAREYLVHYIEDDNAVIYLTGYSSQGTASRTVLEGVYDEELQVNGIICHKKATVTFTGEFSSHAKKNELIEYIRSFAKVNCLLLNHGEAEQKISLAKSYKESYKTNIKTIGIIDGKTVYRINSYGFVKSYQMF